MALKPINKENFFAQNPTSPYHYLLDFFTDFRISSKDALLLFLPNLYCLTMKPQHFCSSEFGRNKMCYIINLWLLLMKGREGQSSVWSNLVWFGFWKFGRFEVWVLGTNWRFAFDGKIFKKSSIFFVIHFSRVRGSLRYSLGNWWFGSLRAWFMEVWKVQGLVF